MTWLLDGNLLVALSLATHPLRPAAARWFDLHVQRFATCPLTQGTLLRAFEHYAPEARPELAMRVLLRLLDLPEHEFWPATFGYEAVPMAQLQGGRQISDAYLAALALHHGGRVATFDPAFAALYPDVVTLVETGEPSNT